MKSSIIVDDNKIVVSNKKLNTLSSVGYSSSSYSNKYNKAKTGSGNNINIQ